MYVLVSPPRKVVKRKKKKKVKGYRLLTDTDAADAERSVLLFG